MARDNNLSNAQVIRWIIFVFAGIFGAFALWLIRDVVMLCLSAIIFAILLTTPVRFFSRLGAPRPLAVILTITLIIAIVIGTTLVLLPDLFGQFRILVVQTIPSAWELIKSDLTAENLTSRYPFLKDSGVNLPQIAEQLSQQLVSGLGSITGQVFPFLGNLLSTLISILVTIFLSLYFVADPETHWRGMIKLVPVRSRPRAREILAKLDLALRRFLQAQVLLMLLTGLSTALALALMKVPLSGALGVITGLFSFIPNFGPVISLVPILAVVIINIPDQVFLALLIFFLIQFVISQVITPLLLGQEVNLPPAMILVSQIIAGVFFGFLGLLLAVPLAAIITVLVRELYVRDMLGDTEVGQRRTAEIEAAKLKVPRDEAPTKSSLA